MTNKNGLTDANDFNENIYRTLEEILCPSEHTNSAQCVYDCDNLEMYNETSFAMAEFGDDIEFILKNGSVYVNFLSAADSAQHGYGLITETGDFTLKKAYLADINGDGKREICYQVHDNSGVIGDHIFIFDCADQKVYGVTGQSGRSEYYLGDIDGELIAYNTECTSDGSRGEVISHEKLSLDMNDCLLHLDCGGHSEFCLHDPSYCERQEGECAYRNSEHHEENSAAQHHGHSEYCLQDAAYCAQQGGDCPYRQSEHHNESNEHHGHGQRHENANVSLTDTDMIFDSVNAAAAYPVGTDYPEFITLDNGVEAEISDSYSRIFVNAENGCNVLAIDKGTVAYTGWGTGLGMCVYVENANGETVIYAHLNLNGGIAVEKGDTIDKCQIIGSTGTTGAASEPGVAYILKK